MLKVSCKDCGEVYPMSHEHGCLPDRKLKAIKDWAKQRFPESVTIIASGCHDIATEYTPDVTKIAGVTKKKRGRPPTGTAMTPAERARRYRAKLKGNA